MQFSALVSKIAAVAAPVAAQLPNLQAFRSTLPKAAQAISAGLNALPAASGGAGADLQHAAQHSKRVASASISAFVDPSRDDKVAELGELTGMSSQQLHQGAHVTTVKLATIALGAVFLSC